MPACCCPAFALKTAAPAAAAAVRHSTAALRSRLSAQRSLSTEPHKNSTLPAFFLRTTQAPSHTGSCPDTRRPGPLRHRPSSSASVCRIAQHRQLNLHTLPDRLHCCTGCNPHSQRLALSARLLTASSLPCCPLPWCRGHKPENKAPPERLAPTHPQRPLERRVSRGDGRVVPRPHVQLVIVLQQQRPLAGVQRRRGLLRLDEVCTGGAFTVSLMNLWCQNVREWPSPA